jgi:DNA-binding beta-propeller fold protein YncE
MRRFTPVTTALAAALTLALLPGSAAAAPCPGAAECPYTSVTQVAAPPAASEIRSPGPLALGSGGTVWIADGATRRVMHFDADGAFLGSVGEGVLQGFIAALAVSPATGDVYVNESFPVNRIVRFSASGNLLGTLGKGTGLGQVNFPTGLAVRPGAGPKAGRLYVSDNVNGGRLQSFSAALDAPVLEGETSGIGEAQLAFNPTGTQLWALPGPNTLRAYDPDDLGLGALVTACPSGTAVGQCQMEGNPSTLSVDAEGKVWIADRANDRIQRFDPNGLNPVAYGSSGGGDLGFVRPLAAVADGGSLWVTDVSGRVRRFDRGTLALQRTFGGPSGTGLRGPKVALAPGGEILQFDGGAGLIRRSTANGTTLATFGQLGPAQGQTIRGAAIATDAGGNLLVLDQDGVRLQKLTPSGGLAWALGPLPDGDPDRLQNGLGVAAGPGGEVFVANANGRNVVVASAAGTVVRRFGSDGTGDGQFKFPAGVVVDDGVVFVLDSTRGDIQRFTPEGQFLGRFGAPGGGPGEFLSPRGIAADGRGSIYVLDGGNSRVVAFGRDGAPRGAFGEPGTGPGQLTNPSSIAADAGAVVVSEVSGRVQRFALVQPAAAPPPAGGPGPGAKPAPLTAGAVFALPSAKRCVKRGAKLTLRFRRPRGVTIERVEVLQGKRRLVRRSGAKARRTITVRAPRKGRSFTLRLRVTPRGGKTVATTRTYRLCPR